MTKEEQNQTEADCLRCYEQGYEIGKQDTIQKVCEWLNKNLVDSDTFDKEWFIERFKQAMEE